MPKWTCAAPAAEYFLPCPPQRQPAGVEREAAQALVNAAHQTCPYSKATRGNIDVTINLGLSRWSAWS
jgi:organic hydroperoxide reductase OsmC/OhrA